MTTALSDLLTWTRDRISEPSASRWTDAELTRHINRRINWLQSKIETYNPDYFLRVETATASSGSYQLAFPANIYGNRLRSLQAYPGYATPVGLAYNVKPGQMEWIYQNLNYSGIPQNYTMLDGYLEWAPLLQYDTCFRFVYALKEVQLSYSYDVLGAIKDEHADIISDGAAIDALSKIDAMAKINVLAAHVSDRLNELANDVTPTDTITIPQVRIDP